MAKSTFKKTAVKAATRRAPATARAKVTTSRATQKTKVLKAEVGTATTNARKVLLAGIGAANRVQDEAARVYGMLATEAKRLGEMTSEAAETLGKKAGVYIREGKKVQSQAAAVAQAKAAETAKEVKAFAKKSEQTLKQNVERTFNATVAGAKQGVTQLEHVFETRVAKTLNTFGIPSSQNVRDLQARMADLQKALNQLNKRGVRA